MERRVGLLDASMRRPWKLRPVAHNAPGQRGGGDCDTLVRRRSDERPGWRACHGSGRFWDRPTGAGVD
jgi:hypothetical protein